jgi:hypothetical protein
MRRPAWKRKSEPHRQNGKLEYFAAHMTKGCAPVEIVCTRFVLPPWLTQQGFTMQHDHAQPLRTCSSLLPWRESSRLGAGPLRADEHSESLQWWGSLNRSRCSRRPGFHLSRRDLETGFLLRSRKGEKQFVSASVGIPEKRHRPVPCRSGILCCQ